MLYTLLSALWNVWWTSRRPRRWPQLQRRRLDELVRFAREHAPFYRDWYRNLPPAVAGEPVKLAELPPVTKSTLMADFDRWVTDPAVTLAGVEAFLADPKRRTPLFLDRYAVWTTSGSTGAPGVFLHDRPALATYAALAALRTGRAWVRFKELVRTLPRGRRTALLLATGGPYAAVTTVELMRHFSPRRLRWVQVFSITQPMRELVASLDRFQPTVIIGYPTVVDLLAQEQQDGRLHIAPRLIVTAAEWLDPTARQRIGQVFGCPVHDFYAASEFMSIAWDCPAGWLHVNSDWVILEPVDADGRPTPPGKPSHSVLLTNLANRIQPLIRYDLGDSITRQAGPCACGNPFPAIRVEGRRDDILALRDGRGQVVRIPPMAPAEIVEETPGVRRYQIVQTGPSTLALRIDVTPGATREQVWAMLEPRMRGFLSAQGLDNVHLRLAPEPPQRDPRSGKYRQVYVA
ncbi:MAG: phenylacetate--CoA ligase family protein, partial [Caldilineae bacterium]